MCLFFNKFRLLHSEMLGANALHTCKKTTKLFISVEYLFASDKVCIKKCNHPTVYLSKPKEKFNRA